MDAHAEAEVDVANVTLLRRESLRSELFVLELVLFGCEIRCKNGFLVLINKMGRKRLVKRTRRISLRKKVPNVKINVKAQPFAQMGCANG